MILRNILLWPPVILAGQSDRRISSGPVVFNRVHSYSKGLVGFLVEDLASDYQTLPSSSLSIRCMLEVLT